MSIPSELGQLNPGEELKLQLRPTSRILLPAVVIMLILAPIPIVDFLDILIFLIVIWGYFSQVRARRYFVTSDRIIFTRKFLSRDRRDIFLQNVSDFTVNQGIWGRIFGFGSIIPVTLATLSPGATMRGKKKQPSSRTLFALGGIRKPYDVINTLQSVRLASSRSQQVVVTREVLVTCRNCGARAPQGTVRCQNCGANL